jgi:ABC-2 type transport system permease protein
VINVIAQFFPSTPAINGFLRLNQMGDSIENLVGIRAQLWWLVGLYASISFALMTLKQKRLNTLVNYPATKDHGASANLN